MTGGKRARGISRRGFLGGAIASGGALALAGCADDGDPAVAVGGGEVAAEAVEPQYVEFFGAHQTGVTTPAPAAGLMAAFDVYASDRDELEEMFRSLSDETRRLMAGEEYDEPDDAYPALHAGTLGNPPPPADLSVIVSVGASLFDDRYRLADRKPRELVKMPFFANDRLDPAQSHGDLLLSISADTPDVCVFTLRQLMRQTRGSLVLHWMVEGFNRRLQPAPGQAPVRNLLGFRDGTANLDPSSDALMDRHVWVRPGDGEPEWASGGTYLAARTIRMFVEFWDRTPLSEQQLIIGREKESGAPLDGEVETDTPDFVDDLDGDITPLDAHIRLANPRTPETDENLILRRGFSFSRGFDGAGRLDQGLAFVSFQRSLDKGFVTVQKRLDGEPLEEYIQPVGGGFFYVLPGVEDEGGYLGEGLLA
jgi:deferrochelatase/peroxidase EfeB